MNAGLNIRMKSFIVKPWAKLLKIPSQDAGIKGALCIEFTHVVLWYYFCVQSNHAIKENHNPSF